MAPACKSGDGAQSLSRMIEDAKSSLLLPAAQIEERRGKLVLPVCSCFAVLLLLLLACCLCSLVLPCEQLRCQSVDDEG